MSNFMFYENFLNALELLPEGEREKACYEFCKYGVTGELPKNKSIAMFCIGVSISVRKFDGRGGARQGSGAPKGNQNAIKKQSDNEIQSNNQKQSKQSNSEKQSEMINININKNKNLKNNISNTEVFKKPTLEEIKSYCQERNNRVDSQRFFDFYESKGWYVGKNKMKDWKAAVRNWERSCTVNQIPVGLSEEQKEEAEKQVSIAELTKQRLREEAIRKYGS